MAIITLNYTIVDKKGDSSTIRIPIGSSATPATAVAALKVFAPVVGALVTGSLSSAFVTIEASVTGFPALPAAIADVQEKAAFAFRGVNAFLKRIGIPTFNEDKMLPSSADVDTSDLDVAAFVTAVTTGIDTTSEGGSGVVGATDTRGDDLLSLEYAREEWGKRRKS
jgi:hypothetical protein